MAEVDHNEDRFASVNYVLSQMYNAANFPEGAVSKIEIGFQANGEATWRAWPARADEPESGFIAADS